MGDEGADASVRETGEVMRVMHDRRSGSPTRRALANARSELHRPDEMLRMDPFSDEIPAASRVLR